MPGPADNNETFRYNANTSQTGVTGTIYLTSSGQSRNVIRTVKVGIRRQGFLDFLYLTDYEIVDPALSGDPTTCEYRAWQWNPNISNYGPDTTNCSIVYWTDSAVLNGPVHTNDGLYVCGCPQLQRQHRHVLQLADEPECGRQHQVRRARGGAQPVDCANTPVFQRLSDPASRRRPAVPAGQHRDSHAGRRRVGGTGCLYTGPTTISLHNTGNVGFMDVTSPATKSTNPGCGPGTNLSLPANGVIYVQTVPSSHVGPELLRVRRGGVQRRRERERNARRPAHDRVRRTTSSLTNNLVYHQYPSGTDVLGLIAEQRRRHLPPGEQQRREPTRGSLTNPTVDAAILALDHSFYVQNWNMGAPLGNLTVNGVISQEFRGAVGTFSGTPPVIQTGYNKNYTYDTRLKYLSPPYFLSPTLSAWQRISYAEITPTATP